MSTLINSPGSSRDQSPYPAGLVSASKNHAKAVAIAAMLAKKINASHFVKDEPASRNTYCKCCAYQHRYGPADEIETTSSYCEINYKDLYDCAGYAAEELTD